LIINYYKHFDNLTPYFDTMAQVSKKMRKRGFLIMYLKYCRAARS